MINNNTLYGGFIWDSDVVEIKKLNLWALEWAKEKVKKGRAGKEARVLKNHSPVTFLKLYYGFASLLGLKSVCLDGALEHRESWCQTLGAKLQK
ncbi:hypothetical protein Tco_0985499 [Tanacetum coccineum]